jgi:hypothetical protein
MDALQNRSATRSSILGGVVFGVVFWLFLRAPGGSAAWAAFASVVGGLFFGLALKAVVGIVAKSKGL